jgi:hypothetical protein
MGRAHMATAFAILVGTCLAGALHATLYAALTGSCTLALLSLTRQRALALPSHRGVSEPVLVAASLLNATAVAFAAYAFGYVSRWIWGL